MAQAMMLSMVIDSDPALPSLDAEAVRRLGRSWDDGGLWSDIAWLAERFLSSQPVDQAVAGLTS